MKQHSPLTAIDTVRLLAFGLVASLLVLATNLLPAAAHTTEQPYLYVFVGESSVDGRVELAVGDVETVLGIDLGEDDVEIEATLRDNADALKDYVSEHLAIAPGDGSETWPLELGQVDLFREAPGTLAFAVVQFTAEVGFDTPPQQVAVSFDPFYDEVEGRDGLLLLKGGYDTGSFDPDKEILVTFTIDDREQTVDLGRAGQWGNFTSGITLGIDHLKTGPDHILFILALLLPSVLVFSGGWSPATGFGSALWRVLKIATFFTIAHSITFTLAGMGWLPTPPSKVVETIIAASIAAAALHNLRPIYPNREWALSFVFGLFHGMGFASLVDSLDVSRGSQLISLIGRNVGIEIGQVVVILVLFPGLFLLSRTALYQPFLTVASLLLAALAGLWMLERITETDFGTDGVVGTFASVPAGYWVAAIFTAGALACYLWARRSEQLVQLP